MQPEEMIRVTNTVQFMLLSVSAVMSLMLLFIAFRFRTKTAIAYTIGLLTYTLHSTVFYALAAVDLIPSQLGNLWSALLRMHISIYLLGTLTVFFITYYQESRGKPVGESG